MITIMLVSHGKFASGMREAAEMIYGECANCRYAELLQHQGPEDFTEIIAEEVKRAPHGKVLFLVDLWGGTPFNCAKTVRAQLEGETAIISGVNLGLLLEAIMYSRKDLEFADFVTKLVERGRGAISEEREHLSDDGKVKNQPPVRQTSNGTAVVSGSAPSDKTQIDLVLTRVDSRLLHGQVSTQWCKLHQPDRILVVSDAVARDKLRRTFVSEASPPGVRATARPLQKFIEVARDARFAGVKVLALFENPQDLAKAVDAGIEISTVNLGSMAHSEGKVVVSKALAFGRDDLDSLLYLRDRGIEFDVRKVPSDSKIPFTSLVHKAKSLKQPSF